MSFNQLLYVVVILFLVSMSVVTFGAMKGRRKSAGNFKKSKFRQLQDDALELILKTDDDSVFQKTRINIGVGQYNMIRAIVLFSLLALIIISSIRDGANTTLFAIWVVLFVVSYPVVYIGSYKSPFGYIIDMLETEYKGAVTTELYRSLTQLKNVAIAQREKPLGAMFIIQMLAQFSDITKPAYMKVLDYLQKNQIDEADKYFTEYTDTELGSKMANLFVKLDAMNPAELVQNIIILQEAAREEKNTQTHRRDEFLSNIGYLFTTALVAVIFLDMIVISVWVDFLTAF